MKTSAGLGQIRLAMAQVNPKVGALDLNADLIAKFAGHARKAGAHIVVFPEMVMTGYPVEDLALRPSFRQASRRAIVRCAEDLARKGFGEMVFLIGYLDQDQFKSDAPQNALAIIHGGEVKARYNKHHLPNYGVFDEYRNFVAGSGSLIFRFHGIDIGVAICEDIWQEGGPVADLARRSPGLLVVVNGSPFERAKSQTRLALIQRRAKQIGAPLVYVNMTGGQDDLVFDGGSTVVDAQGDLIARAPQFDEGLAIVDLDLLLHSSEPDLIISQEPLTAFAKVIPEISEQLSPEGEIWQGLVLGLRDYVEKNGFTTVALGLSGGIDSAVVATLAADGLGPDRVHAVAMPSKYSSDHSLADAKALALNTGIHYKVVEIESIVATYLSAINLEGLAQENVQARVRGTILMGLSNQEGHLILATGNKSELAVGYSTLYGDAVGGFAPIKDIYKVDVWALARWRNDLARKKGEVPPIPENSITKEPSAELRPGQKDSDSLPEYSILDRILVIYIEESGGVEEVVAEGFDRALATRVIAMVDKAEYKRRQYPPGTKVSALAFGKDRRLPMTSGWIEPISS